MCTDILPVIYLKNELFFTLDVIKENKCEAKEKLQV